VLTAILLVLTGLVLLPLAADWLVRGSSALAERLGVSELVVGLTVVALGTSAPELVTGIAAAIKGASGIVLGNAVGSNIANLGLVLGGVALLGRVPVQRQLLAYDVPAMLGVTALTALLAYNGLISRLDGLLLALCLVALMVWTLRRRRPAEDEQPAIDRAKLAVWLIAILVLGGLAGLVFGAEVLVRGAVGLAQLLGVSDTVIGATVVALGTSLPELAASLAAARRRSYGILLGNLVGSCQFNLLAIIGIPALIHPLDAERTMLYLHLPALLLISFLAWAMLRSYSMVKRREGLALVALYFVYIGVVIWRA
jgi:cation:H+ antiporter